MACGWVKAHLSLLPAAPPNSAAADRAAWSSQARGDSYPHESQSRARAVLQRFPSSSLSWAGQGWPIFLLSKFRLQPQGFCAADPLGCRALHMWGFAFWSVLKPQVILSHDPKTKEGPWISWKRIQGQKPQPSPHVAVLQKIYSPFYPFHSSSPEKSVL